MESVIFGKIQSDPSTFKLALWSGLRLILVKSCLIVRILGRSGSHCGRLKLLIRVIIYWSGLPKRGSTDTAHDFASRERKAKLGKFTNIYIISAKQS